jgi:hypothetical protein
MYCMLQIVDRVKWLERCALQPIKWSRREVTSVVVVDQALCEHIEVIFSLVSIKK